MTGKPLVLLLLAIQATTAASRLSASQSTRYAPSMHQARVHFAAAALPEGRVLVAGGQSGHGGCDALWSAEVYDPASGWSVTAPMNQARAHFTLSTLPDGRVLAVGGVVCRGGIQQTAEVYDPDAGTWTYTGATAVHRSRHAAVTLTAGEHRGQVLVLGGDDGFGEAVHTAEVYDPATGLWSQTSNLTDARMHPQAVALVDGRVLVAGGYLPGIGSLSTAEIFAPETGIWSPTGDMRAARDGTHRLIVLPDGDVLATGGRTTGDGEGATLRLTERYDARTARWVSTGPMSEARAAHTATLLNDGTVVVAGGADEDALRATIERYDPTTGHWWRDGRLREARADFVAVLLPDGTVVLAGGRVPYAPAVTATVERLAWTRSPGDTERDGAADADGLEPLLFDGAASLVVPSVRDGRVDKSFGTAGVEGASRLGMAWYRDFNASYLATPAPGLQKMWTVGKIDDRRDCAGGTLDEDGENCWTILGLPDIDESKVPFSVIWHLLPLAHMDAAEFSRSLCQAVPVVLPSVADAFHATWATARVRMPQEWLTEIKKSESEWVSIDKFSVTLPDVLSFSAPPCQGSGLTVTLHLVVPWSFTAVVDIFPDVAIDLTTAIDIDVALVPRSTPNGIELLVRPRVNARTDLEARSWILFFCPDRVCDIFKNTFASLVDLAIEAAVGRRLSLPNIDVTQELVKQFFPGLTSPPPGETVHIPTQDEVLEAIFDRERNFIRLRIQGERRYGEYWEVANEPNWFPQVEPALYAAHYTRYYRYIKSLDPSAHVLNGGLFLKELLETPSSFTLDFFGLGVGGETLGTAIGGLLFSSSTEEWYTAFRAHLPADVRVDVGNLHAYPVGRTVDNLRWTGAGFRGGPWRAGDYNGDGNDDILRLLTAGVGGAEVLESTGSGFDIPVRWTGAGFNGRPWYIGDFDGDDKEDLLRVQTLDRGADVLVSTGTAFRSPVSWTSAPYSTRWYVGDFDGDGSDDIFTTHRLSGQPWWLSEGGALVLLSNDRGFAPPVAWTDVPLPVGQWYVGDFNGDGKDDIFRQLSWAGGAEVLISTGRSFKAPVRWSGAGFNGDTWYVGDYNGDGKDDILRRLNTAGGAEVFLSDGKRFAPAPNFLWSRAGTNGGRWYVADVNGDGRTDIFRQRTTSGGADVFESNGARFVPSIRRLEADWPAARTRLGQAAAFLTAGGTPQVWVTEFGNIDRFRGEDAAATLNQQFVDYFICNTAGITKWFWFRSLSGTRDPLGHAIETALLERDAVTLTSIGQMYQSRFLAPLPLCTTDLTHDGDIDVDDLALLVADHNKTVRDSACGLRCDLDGDGTITALDARILTTRCTRSGCAR